MFEALAGGLAGDGLDLPLDGGHRPLGGVGVDVGLPAASLPVPFDSESEEVEAFVDVDHSGLVVVEAQPHGRQHRFNLGSSCLGVGSGSGYQHDEIVRVADQPVGGLSLGTPVAASLVVLPEPGPRLDEMIIEDGQGDVGKQR